MAKKKSKINWKKSCQIVFISSISAIWNHFVSLYTVCYWEEDIDLFMSFETIFWDVILGWYYNILGWKFIMIFNWEKNPKDMNKAHM